MGVPNEGPIVRDAGAQCQTGERATGGGIQSATPEGEPNLAGGFGTYAIISRPSPESGTPTGWFVRAANRSGTTASGGSPATMNAYVICASP